jgi:hypothetical protein
MLNRNFEVSQQQFQDLSSRPDMAHENRRYKIDYGLTTSDMKW